MNSSLKSPFILVMVHHWHVSDRYIFSGTRSFAVEGSRYGRKGYTYLTDFLFMHCTHPFMQNYQISRGNKYGEGAFLGVSHATTHRGPSNRQFWRFLTIYTYTLCHGTTKFDVVTRAGWACILGSATPPIQRRSFSTPQFDFFLYLCLHLLT